MIYEICLIFYRNSQKSENLCFAGLVLSKAYKGLDQKVQKSHVSWQWRMIQSLREKMIFDSNNDMKNFVNFNASSDKSEILNLYLWILSIASKVSAKKVQNNDLSLHRKLIETLKKNWLFVSKMT